MSQYNSYDDVNWRAFLCGSSIPWPVAQTIYSKSIPGAGGWAALNEAFGK